MARKKKSVTSRIEGKYTIDDNQCFIWTAATGTQGQYPVIRGDGDEEGKGKPRYVYHLTWEAENGQIPTTPPPDGSRRWELHHICFNRLCIRASHVRLLTQKQHAKLHRRTAPRFPLKNVPDAGVLDFPGFMWHRMSHGWGWSAEL
jgi:HNH endonuclease